MRSDAGEKGRCRYERSRTAIAALGCRAKENGAVVGVVIDGVNPIHLETCGR